MAGAARRMLLRKLSAAFEKWQYEAAEAARSQYMMGGAIRRMLMRKVSMAFEKWQEAAAELEHTSMLAARPS